jgi:hypothetical protein
MNRFHATGGGSRDTFDAVNFPLYRACFNVVG